MCIISHETCNTKKKNRRRNITWFNPPYSVNVRTNIGQEFFKLIDRAFPPSNPLSKIFGRQTVKISYKCMPSMAKAVSRHYVKLSKEDQEQAQTPPGCNCRGVTAVCPVQGRCKTDSVVYRAAVTELGTLVHGKVNRSSSKDPSTRFTI